MNGTLVSSDMTKVYLNHRLNELFTRLARVWHLRSLQLSLQKTVFIMKGKSKKISYILRHRISEEFLPGGWLAVNTVLEEVGITMDELETIVAQNDKGRYQLSEDKTLIRALYGHSVPVELAYIPSQPPALLYHGTAVKNYESILDSGIVSRNRQFVHLSEDVQTAVSVGQRHGDPVVLQVDAKRMSEDGYLFYSPKNSIWLTEYVLPQYILRIE